MGLRPPCCRGAPGSLGCHVGCVSAVLQSRLLGAGNWPDGALHTGDAVLHRHRTRIPICGPLISAGLAAAVCALSREYGWIALVGGVVALVWRGAARRQIFVFAAVVELVAAPWYVNLIIAGNPFTVCDFWDSR
jgi:hypothetical protein